jgi:putative iron-dependent peroxidase
VIEQMLRNMFIGDPPGNHDRLLDFSAAVTGSLFFVPSVDFLEGAPAPATAEAEATREPSPDTSLRIGSLREP